MKVSQIIKALSVVDGNAEIEFYDEGEKKLFCSLSITHESLLLNTDYLKRPQTVRLTIIEGWWNGKEG